MVLFFALFRSVFAFPPVPLRMRTASLLVLLAAATPALAGVEILVTDRGNDSVWFMHDDNNNGVIDEPGELTRWYGAGNASGQPAALNPNTIAYDNGLCLIGDQDSSARRIYWTRDLTGDGDAMDAGEAGVYADITVAGVGQYFAFPTGAAFDENGVPFIVNAGNGFGPDAVWRAADGNSDLDANDPGETTSFVTINGFGTTNGAYSPQEIAFGAEGALYLRNSSGNATVNRHGVFRYADGDGSGVIDQPGEETVFFGVGNADGVTLSAGFAVAVDPRRERSFYFHMLATGGVDQVFRLRDLNADNDAMDAGEATLVWQTGEDGFSSIDAAPLADGSVLVSDNSGARVVRLTDLTCDGDFDDAGERTNFFANTTGALMDARNIAIVTDATPGCDCLDFNNDGLFPDNADLEDYLSVFGGGACSNDPHCADLDFNNDGLFPDNADIEAFFRVFGGGSC